MSHMSVGENMRKSVCGSTECSEAYLNIGQIEFFFSCSDILIYQISRNCQISGVRSHELNKKDFIHQKIVRKKTVTWTSDIFDGCLFLSIRKCVERV